MPYGHFGPLPLISRTRRRTSIRPWEYVAKQRTVSPLYAWLARATYRNTRYAVSGTAHLARSMSDVHWVVRVAHAGDEGAIDRVPGACGCFIFLCAAHWNGSTSSSPRRAPPLLRLGCVTANIPRPGAYFCPRPPSWAARAHYMYICSCTYKEYMDKYVRRQRHASYVPTHYICMSMYM